MTCKDCLHYELCDTQAFNGFNKNFEPEKDWKYCGVFKDKSKYIELPYEICNKTIKFENGEVVITEKPKKWLKHPTQKPVPLLEYLIKTYTDEDDTVLDNCMGSGSTGVACINLKRNFIGFEKDKTFFEFAKNRINQAIHDNPELLKEADNE